MSACTKCGVEVGLFLEHNDGRRECPRCIDAERELLRARVAELEDMLPRAVEKWKDLERRYNEAERFNAELVNSRMDDARKRDALAAQLKQVREDAREARSHLGAALTQTIDSDDQIIVGHIRDALAFLTEPAPPKEDSE